MTSTDSDVLDRSQLLKALATAATGKDARNILLAGPWGSGKTTLLRGLRAHVETSGDNAPYVIWFSPWDTVADGEAHVDALAGVIEAAGADGDDFALLGLFLGGVGDDQSAGRHFFLLEGSDDQAVGEGDEPRLGGGLGSGLSCHKRCDSSWEVKCNG